MKLHDISEEEKKILIRIYSMCCFDELCEKCKQREKKLKYVLLTIFASGFLITLYVYMVSTEPSMVFGLNLILAFVVESMLVTSIMSVIIGWIVTLYEKITKNPNGVFYQHLQ